MNYAKIEKNDLINGTGVRVTLFVSGCSHGCKECYNESAWNYNSGTNFTDDTLNDIIEYLKPDYISGLSLLGGDPLMRKNIDQVLDICKKVKEIYPEKDIWCWTGYTYDQVLNNHAKPILDYIDVLIDGLYDHSLRDTTLKFRGSSNQKILKKGEDF